MKRSLALLSSLAFAAPALALDFNPIYDATATPAQIAAFQSAMADWSSRLSNPVTINISFVGDPNFNFGGYEFDSDPVAFGTYKAALATHATSALDTTTVANLAGTGNTYQALVNGSNQAGGATHAVTLDGVLATPALLKALGLSVDPSRLEARVYYSRKDNRFDFDRGDGIDAGLLDFGGLMRTYIGGVLGHFSGADTADAYANAGFDDADFEPYHSPLDLFRYENANGPARSWTSGTDPKYFSVDGGATSLADFHTGYANGDGQFAEYLVQPNGVFSELAVPGKLYSISDLDLQSMDAIGWNLKAVPEPAPLAVLALGALAFLRRRK